MKRDFLEGLKLEADVIDKIMAENGRDIEREKAKFADYDDVKKQLETANTTLDKFKDYDQTKADVEKYKAEAKKAQEEAAAKISQLELQQKIKDYTGTKKFVNDFTRDSINNMLTAELNKAESKGKSVEEIFKTLTDGKENILVDDKKPTPPTVGKMGGTPPKDDDVNTTRAIMGLPPLKD